MRHAPGSALALACGILALVLCWAPHLSAVFGLCGLFNAWRANRTARKAPDRYTTGSAVLTSTVLVLVAWGIGLMFLILLAGVMAKPVVASPDPAICF